MDTNRIKRFATEARNILKAGIAAKPKYHLMDEGRASDSARDMNEIGG